MFRRLVKSLLGPINHSAVIILGLYTLLWGAWLLSPAWDVFTSAQLYSVMTDIAPEWAWGLTAIISGIPIIYGAIRPSYKTMIFGAFVGALHWALVAIVYLLGDWNNTGGITSGFIFAYSAFIYINVRINKMEFEKPAEHVESLDTD